MCKNSWTDLDAVWNAELGGSRQHVLHGDVDVPAGRGTFESVWLIEKHCKA